MADLSGNTTFSPSQSYTDHLYQRVKGWIGTNLTHVKLGCPGETTDQFTGGDITETKLTLVYIPTVPLVMYIRGANLSI